MRLRTLADVFASAAARGVELRLDGTEVQVGAGAQGKPGRRAFVSRKKKQNTKKATVITDGEGRTLYRQARSAQGGCADQTAVRTEGIADLFTQFPQVKAKVDAGYRGWPRTSPIRSRPRRSSRRRTPPRKKPQTYEAERHKQSSERICVEHANAEHRAMANPPALPRTTRRLRRDLPGRRRPGLRPRRRTVTPRQPTRQASTAHR